jgi:multiple sugar transport system ATP-binding protein
MMPLALCHPHAQDAPPASASCEAVAGRRASTLALRGIGKSFGRRIALADIDLHIAPGEFVAIVGPSGCGKSTLLRVIAGVEEAERGELWLNGAAATDLPARDRDLAMVFQAYALYPHLTVFRNLALPLEVRKLPRQVVETRVAQAADLLDIAYLLNRRPGLLSGGQRQRVALARALVRSAPLYLLDEPLSSLDARQRTTLRTAIGTLHRTTGATVLYATHDLAEAMALADRIVVMREGRIEQVAAPRDLCANPTNAFVAGFIGAQALSLAATMERTRSAGAAPPGALQ